MRNKIFMFCTATLLVSLAVQTILFGVASSGIIYAQEREASKRSIENMHNDLHEFSRQMEKTLHRVYEEPEILFAMGSRMPSRELQRKYQSYAHEFAVKTFEPAQSVVALYVYTMDEKLVSLYRHATTPLYNYPDDLFKVPEETNASKIREYLASDEKGLFISSYYNEYRKKNLVRFVIKLFTNNATRKVGFLVCDVDSKAFMKIMEKYIYSDDQVVWLQPSGDMPILETGALPRANVSYYHRMIDEIKTNIWTGADARRLDKGTLFEFHEDDYNLNVLCLLPRTYFEKNSAALSGFLSVIAASIIALSFFASALIANGLTKPLTKLSATVNRIKDGETSLRFANPGNDEVGSLGRAFNEMLDQIEDHLSREYRLELSMNDARYKALQSQINPHFLYNTLDTMGGIALSRKCPEVSDLSRTLSGLFRYSLDMKSPAATIGEELEHVRNYLYIMNVRFGNSIGIEFRVDDDILGERIPRISLQPIVENAIQHGLRNKHGEKSIVIQGYRQDGDVCVSVSDNGVGMDSEKINAQLSLAANDPLQKTGSIGLGNINARLRLLYSDRYGVRVFSEAGSGSMVLIRLPSGATNLGGLNG